MKKVHIVGLPRLGDPEIQRKLWVGMELSCVEPDPSETAEQIPDSYIWVDYEEVICEIEKRGDVGYANFFRKLRQTPGGSQAPGLLIERIVCEEI